MGDNVMANNDTVPLLQRNEHHRRPSSDPFLYIVVAVSLLAPISAGYTIGYSSPAIPQLKNDTILDDNSASWFGSLLNVGAIFGGPVAGFLIGSIGRKATLMACAVPFAVGWALIASVPYVWGLYLGRVLTGFATGMTTLACPIYIAEMASPDNRGFLGSSFQLFITLGILLVYTLGVYLSYVWLAIIGAIFACMLSCFMLPMPDTPSYWLIKHDRHRALAVLHKVRNVNVDVDLECREIEATLDNSDNNVSLSEFGQRHLFMPLLISLALMFFQQFSGINTVMFYTVTIFQSTGSSIDANTATIVIGAVQVVATLVSVMLMDLVGRKVLLITAGVLMAISSTTFGLYYFLTKDEISPTTPSGLEDILLGNAKSDLGWLSLSSMVIYIIGFSLGLGPIPWLIMSEIFPSKARGLASSIATAFNWTCSFIITKEFLDLENLLHKEGVFWMYAVVCVLEIIFVILFVPETKGKSLEEIEDYFRRRE
ncbi:hypothetical protein BSL78_27632 [Apostichopus japonicus]|uniref:Major facilitator superfamily (MFS) profile domain-containing protein n=2 Tax=Stichopus japonicus TaxID=307972 RepID=A0A2G8JII7_STIJA|nr:hypothetical protein BSL78_27632 [Apostichopus japonicus]